MADHVEYLGAADAGPLGPAVDARLEERAVDDQLPAPGEQVDQARLAVRPFEYVVLLHGDPGHAPALGGQRVPGACHLLLLDEQLLVRGRPLPRRDDRRCVHGEDLQS
jgi:hypothetical protein